MESNKPIDQIVKELDQIHCYNLIEILGEGSFGTVYKAQSKMNGKTYAIKVYKKPFMSSFTAR